MSSNLEYWENATFQTWQASLDIVSKQYRVSATYTAALWYLDILLSYRINAGKLLFSSFLWRVDHIWLTNLNQSISQNLLIHIPKSWLLIKKLSCVIINYMNQFKILAYHKKLFYNIKSQMDKGESWKFGIGRGELI